MRAFFVRIAPALHLTRVTTAFAAVGDVWFVILWTLAFEKDEPGAKLKMHMALPTLLLGGAAAAIGIYAFAQALNDTLDLRRDRVLHPLRPLPAGKLNVDAALAMVVLSLIVATLGALALGQDAAMMCLLTAGAVFFYNAAAKFVPAVGLVALSLIYAAHMLIPNVGLVFVWPVWLVMTHALLVGAATHRLGRRRPTLSMATIVAATLGWAFWSLALLYVGRQRGGSLWPDFVRPTAAIGPFVLAVAFVIFAWRKARKATTPAKAADKITRYGALWLTLYGVAWMAGQGRWGYAAILAGLAAIGFLGMTALRELYAILERPLEYRR